MPFDLVMKVCVKSAILVCTPAFTIAHAGADSPYQHEYDYVIVGGGVAGLVVANRLSEDSHCKVIPNSSKSANADCHLQPVYW